MPPPKKPKTLEPSGPANWEGAADAVKKALDEWNVTIPQLYSLYVPFKLGQLSALPALASKAMEDPQYHKGGWKEVGIKQNIDFLNDIRNKPEALKKFLGDLKVYLEKKLGTLPLQPPPSSMEGGGGRLLPEQQQPSSSEQQSSSPEQQPSSPEQQPSSPEQQQLSYQQQQQLSYQQQQLSYQQQQQPTFTSSPMEGGGGCLLPQQPFYYQQQQPFYYQQQPPFPLSPLFPPQPSLPHDVCLALSHLYANVFLPPSGNL